MERLLSQLYHGQYCAESMKTPTDKQYQEALGKALAINQKIVDELKKMELKMQKHYLMNGRMHGSISLRKNLFNVSKKVSNLAYSFVKNWMNYEVISY